MTNEEEVAPTLSTYQDHSTFEFSKADSELKDRSHLGDFDKNNSDELRQKIIQFYGIEQLVDFLKQKKDAEDSSDDLLYKRVTLQFPDNLICDSATIVHELQDRLNIMVSTSAGENDGNCDKISCNCKHEEGGKSTSNIKTQRLWILADTSYSACCVDEVAAEHVNSDLVVHFGDACLNPISRTQALFILGSPEINKTNLLESFKEKYPEQEFKDERILLMADAPHTSHLREIYPHLKTIYKGLSYGELTLDGNPNASILGQEMVATEGFHVLNRNIIGHGKLEAGSDYDGILSEYNLFHVTIPEVPRLLQLTTTFKSCTIYDPSKQEIFEGPFPNLMKRYRYMSIARTAGSIGLLVNTLSLANTKTLINKIAKKIKDAGKKHYIFVVGKPNVAKLANFESIDVWCILGCDHQGIIVDQYNEYFKPIITPYELLLSLSDEITWTGKWVTNFNSILNTIKKDEESHSLDSDKEPGDSNQSKDDDEDDVPVFDPVTGRLVSNSRPLRRIKHLQITANEDSQDSESGSLVKKFSNAVTIKDTVSTSAIHLQSRHWTGLGSDFDKDSDEGTKGAKVEEGRGGIARGYDFDMEVNK